MRIVQRMADLEMENPLIGIAGWALGPENRKKFPSEGTHLQRYASVFPAVEINSSFYRPHRVATYAKWAASVPNDFRFSVKIPKTITHVKRLEETDELFDQFLREISGLGGKLGCLLVQLPPSLAFDPAVADRFFASLREKHPGDVSFEPRHKTWFADDAAGVLQDHRISRVAADPAVVPEAAEPGGAAERAYFRLHGSPQVYYSAYPNEYLDRLAGRLRAYSESGVQAWCIFDNTARGEAVRNALDLMRKIERASKPDTRKGSRQDGDQPERGAALLELRTFDEKDEATVVRLWDRCGLLRPWNDPHKDIGRKLHVQSDLFLVGTVGGEVVGTVMAGYDGHRGWVNYLAVDPSHRLRGFGATLMKEAERRLSALGCPKVNLQIRADNEEAVRFYERIGFARDDVVSMGKRLEHDR